MTDTDTARMQLQVDLARFKKKYPRDYLALLKKINGSMRAIVSVLERKDTADTPSS